MLIRPPRLSVALVACCLMAVSASAQDTTGSTYTAPANLAFAEGLVDVVHEGVTERADPPLLLVDGDLVRTRNGRAEIVFGDGSVLHLDHDAEVELLGPERLRVLTGRVVFRMSSSAARPYVMDTPGGSVRFDSSGEYGVTTDERRQHLEVTVARGSAEIDDAQQRVRIRAGEMAWISGAGARTHVQSFNSARFDAFASWANDRTHGFTAARSSAQLPYELRPYAAVFDQYGRWDYLTPHGYVWFPSVATTWRPYYDGSWGHTRYGWTWHGRDRWAWPTHHYGRWGFNGSFWFWIPANAWAPAWVSWGSLPGYVSWSPLGWDGRPAIDFGRGDHPAYWPDHNPWRSWTVVPRDHFGPRRPVRSHAVDGDRLDEGTRRAMVVHTAPSSPIGGAVPRGTLSAPTAAMPRGDTPRPTGNRRRDEVVAPRPGYVRRPDAPVVERPADAAPSGSPSRRADAPVRAPSYAPAPAQGQLPPPSSAPAPSDAQPRPNGRSRGDAPEYAPPAARERQAEGPPSRPADNDNSRRGDARRPSRESSPPPAAQAPPPASPPAASVPASGHARPSGGGAVRRPPA